MTERELRRLSRQDLLQLLLAQSREVARQNDTITELRSALEQEREFTAGLKAKLDEKDSMVEQLRADINALRTRLDEKDFMLDAARVRLDRLDLGADYPKPRLSSDSELPGDSVPQEERLRRLKELLAQSEAMADLLRKEQK